MSKAAELIVKCLENEGVEVVFGLPGEENIRFVQALASSSIRYVLTRHEQADVAGHQRRRGESDGLPEWEVPRHHGQHHAQGLPAGVGLLRADLGRFGWLVG